MKNKISVLILLFIFSAIASAMPIPIAVNGYVVFIKVYGANANVLIRTKDHHEQWVPIRGEREISIMTTAMEKKLYVRFDEFRSISLSKSDQFVIPVAEGTIGPIAGNVAFIRVFGENANVLIRTENGHVWFPVRGQREISIVTTALANDLNISFDKLRSISLSKCDLLLKAMEGGNL